MSVVDFEQIRHHSLLFIMLTFVDVITTMDCMEKAKRDHEKSYNRNKKSSFPLSQKPVDALRK